MFLQPGSRNTACTFNQETLGESFHAMHNNSETFGQRSSVEPSILMHKETEADSEHNINHHNHQSFSESNHSMIEMRHKSPVADQIRPEPFLLADTPIKHDDQRSLTFTTKSEGDDEVLHNKTLPIEIKKTVG